MEREAKAMKHVFLAKKKTKFIAVYVTKHNLGGAGPIWNTAVSQGYKSII